MWLLGVQQWGCDYTVSGAPRSRGTFLTTSILLRTTFRANLYQVSLIHISMAYCRYIGYCIVNTTGTNPTIKSVFEVQGVGYITSSVGEPRRSPIVWPKGSTVQYCTLLSWHASGIHSKCFNIHGLSHKWDCKCNVLYK